MMSLAEAVLWFSNKLPGALGHQLRRLFASEYLKSFSLNQDFSQDRIAAEADAVFSFLYREIGKLTVRDYGRSGFAPFSYVGIAAQNGGSRASGVGVHSVFGRALFSAMIEFLERFFLTAKLSCKNLMMSPRELQERSMRFLPLDAVRGLGGADLSGDIRVRWVKGRALGGQEEILIPAQMVFWNYSAAREGEPILREPNISGAGSALSEDEAIVYGICELVERDALMLVWYKKIIPPRINPKSITDEEISFLIDQTERRGLAPYILDITSDVAVPAFMVAMVGDKPPMVSRGFSSSLNPLSAIKKAFYEAWGNYIVNCKLLAGPKAAWHPSPMAERYRLWLNPASFRHFRFLLSGREVPLRPSVKVRGNDLEILKGIFSKFGREIYYFAAKHAMLDELGSSVVKVLIPALVPIHFRGENADTSLSSPRLLGNIQNRFPHPFA